MSKNWNIAFRIHGEALSGYLHIPLIGSAGRKHVCKITGDLFCDTDWQAWVCHQSKGLCVAIHCSLSSPCFNRTVVRRRLHLAGSYASIPYTDSVSNEKKDHKDQQNSDDNQCRISARWSPTRSMAWRSGSGL